MTGFGLILMLAALGGVHFFAFTGDPDAALGCAVLALMGLAVMFFTNGRTEK